MQSLGRVIQCADRPILNPDMQSWIDSCTRQTNGPATELLFGVELVRADVAERQIGKVNLVGGPLGLTLWQRGRNRAAEDREFKAKAPPGRISEVSGEVPPLGLEGRMRAVIGWKSEIAHVQGAGITRYVAP